MKTLVLVGWGVLISHASCVVPNPNYCPPEQCNDAGSDALGDASVTDGNDAPPLCKRELLVQRGGPLTNGKVVRIAVSDAAVNFISNEVDTDFHGAWSPDGTRVAVIRNLTSLWVMNWDGTEAREVDSGSSALSWPAWSPDGTRIAYVRLGEENAPSAILSIASTASGAPTNLTPGNDGQGPLSWTPDGSRIVFVSNRTGNLEIFSMRADGNDQVNLTNRTVADSEPVVSPSGGHIAFVSQGRIWTMEDTGATQVNRSGTGKVTHGQPAWSVSGTLYFVKNPGNGSEIWAMNEDGTNQRSIDSDSALDEEPAVSPDGTMIAWTSRRDGNPEIYVSANDGTNPVRLTNHAGSDSRPRWRPCP